VTITPQSTLGSDVMEEDTTQVKLNVTTPQFGVHVPQMAFLTILRTLLA